MIILQFDRGYYKWGELFLVSLAKNSHDETVFINSANLFNYQIKRLKKIYSPLIIENHKIKMKKKERGNIMISRKPYVLLDVMQSFDDQKFLMIDVDMIVRKPLDDLMNKLINSDAALCIQEGLWEGKVYDQLKVPAGVILVSLKAVSLIEKWIEIMENEKEISGIKRGKWYWDQITLWQAFERTKDLNFATIKRTYFQSNFDDKDAIIWSANVSDKKGALKIFNNELNGISN